MLKCVDCGKEFEPDSSVTGISACCDACRVRRLESVSVLSDKSFPGWEPVEEKAWYRHRAVWFVALSVVLAGLGMLAVPRVKHAYDRWSGERAVRRAAEALVAGDVQHAILDARRALELNPFNAEANRIIAQALESAGSPEAQQWRRRLDAIHPGDAENLIAWSKDVLIAGYPETAGEVLEKVKQGDRNSVAYHDTAARIAIMRRDVAAAERHWKEAAVLDPKEERFTLNLAVLRRNFGEARERVEALDVLRELGEKEDVGRTAQRALLADALAQGDAARAKEAAASVASGPGAVFRDRLEHLAILRSSNDPEASRFLFELREGAKTKPDELFQLFLWMSEHDLALLVLDWLRELPPDLIAKPPVCVAVAAARVRVGDWKNLLAEVESGQWGGFEFVRLAYKARALDRLQDPGGSETAWQGAMAASGGVRMRLEALAKLASEWRWDDRAEEALWKLTEAGIAPRWVLDALWAAAARRSDTERLRVVSKLRMDANPQSIEARNNFACLSLLSRTNESGIHDLADALYEEAPDDPHVVSTYALSLYHRGKIEAALHAMRALTPEQLHQPGTARYFGIILAAANRGTEAVGYLTLGEKGVVLPEEKTLLAQARVAASDESAAYLRQLNEAAASPKLEDLPKLVTWMSGHGLAGLVSGWSAGLAPEIASRPEVRVAIAEAHANAMEWRRLREFTESGSWAALDYLRHAYLARAMDSLQDAAGAGTIWMKAAAGAAENGAGALERLARLAQGFGWEKRSEDVLWRLAMEPRCPRWAAESLWQSSLQHGSAARLAQSSQLLAQSDSRHARIRDSAIVAAMLAHSNEGAIFEFARVLHAAAPKDGVSTVIHALALLRQGRAAEAQALIRTVNPDALKEPRNAIYYAVFLTVAQRAPEAAEYFESAASGTLLLEEKALAGKARAAVQARSDKTGER
jgi:Flp pilus assembly protein TadD/DNA-directed RNA polymerase subunit RPC12/RpoP